MPAQLDRIADAYRVEQRDTDPDRLIESGIRAAFVHAGLDAVRAGQRLDAQDALATYELCEQIIGSLCGHMGEPGEALGRPV